MLLLLVNENATTIATTLIPERVTRILVAVVLLKVFLLVELLIIILEQRFIIIIMEEVMDPLMVEAAVVSLTDFFGEASCLVALVVTDITQRR